MDINWKQLSQCPAYKSIKASYIKDLQRKHRSRSKEEYYKVFRQTIDIAINHSLHLNTSVEGILLVWETQRGNQWWYGFYANKKKIHSKSLYPWGVKARLKHSFYRRSSPKKQREKNLFEIMREQKANSTKKKKRWSPARRKRGW